MDEMTILLLKNYKKVFINRLSDYEKNGLS